MLTGSWPSAIAKLKEASLWKTLCASSREPEDGGGMLQERPLSHALVMKRTSAKAAFPGTLGSIFLIRAIRGGRGIAAAEKQVEAASTDGWFCFSLARSQAIRLQQFLQSSLK